MSRHIDADELIEFFDGYPDHIEFDVEDIKSIINEQDTADVVEVVRCRDCKYATYDKSIDSYDCHFWSGDHDQYTEANDFCSYGERKDEGL